MWVKQCHLHHPRVITISIGGGMFTIPSHGCFMALLYPYGGSTNGDTPKMLGFYFQNPMKTWMILGYPYFRTPPNHHETIIKHHSPSLTSYYPDGTPIIKPHEPRFKPLSDTFNSSIFPPGRPLGTSLRLGCALKNLPFFWALKEP